MINSGWKCGFITATATVVGSVIGSGVFFKTEEIVKITDGNITAGALAWVVGAVVMVLCLFAFAEIIGNNGIKGSIGSISKSINSENFSRFAGVFTAVVYYPSLVSALAYVTAKYTMLTLGGEGMLCSVLPFLFLAISFFQNAFYPKISGKVQIVTTILKLIPLASMIALGIPRGDFSQSIMHKSIVPFGKALFPSVTATLFAYEGWISATSIGKRLENGKKTLPVALVTGGGIISAVYILYYLGLVGAVRTETLINYGAEGVKMAFSTILGRWGGMLTAFVAVSCYGALNALVAGCGCSCGEVFCKSEKKSCFIAFVISSLWLSYLLLEKKGMNFSGIATFDCTELPVVTIYAVYIPIFFTFAKKKKNLKTAIVCGGGIMASLFAVLCGIYAHTDELLSYGAVLFAIFLLCKKR